MAGFSLVELLIVVAIVAILAALLFPVVTRATLRAKVARVHCELEQVGRAIQMYCDDWHGKPPPTRTYCTGMIMKVNDYNELPPELYNYISTARFYDPFNPDRTYKYAAPGPGYSNGTETILGIWIPDDYPTSLSDRGHYYYDQAESPLKWAVWSVGLCRNDDSPEAVDLFTSERRRLPVRRSWWYPINVQGIIVRLSDGRKSP